MMSRFVDYDHHTGITEIYHKDAISGVIKINKSQDTQLLTDINKRERLQSGSGWKEEFHKVASIPLIIIEMWREELKAEGRSNPDPLAKCNQLWFIAKLNSSDFLKLRTKEGVI